MTIFIDQVDAFADRPFAGNPAAVCVLAGPRDERWMQNVAMEMNLSETAFLHPAANGFHLRWFTPAHEVDLCGHATLASAHVLFERRILQPADDARFHTRSGLLTCRKDDAWIKMDFPALFFQPCEAPEDLRRGLKVEILSCSQGMDYLVEVASAPVVRGLEPDFALLKELNSRGVIVTARSDLREFDFISRFFAPAAGIDEDPVTGSAHCALGPFWRERLGKDVLTGYQSSRRGGVVRVEVQGDRVLLSGRAITIMSAELAIEASA